VSTRAARRVTGIEEAVGEFDAVEDVGGERRCEGADVRGGREGASREVADEPDDGGHLAGGPEGEAPTAFDEERQERLPPGRRRRRV
jgi:hypothetical protein